MKKTNESSKSLESAVSDRLARTSLLLVISIAVTITSFPYHGYCNAQWNESLKDWNLIPHQDQKDDNPHAENLRSDKDFRSGSESIAFDVTRTDLKGSYTELRLTFPQPMDARSFDNLHLSFHVPKGMHLSRFDVNLSTPDWKGSYILSDAIKQVTGEWQDITIPLSQFSARDGSSMDWANIGSLLILFYWDEGAKQKGTVHVDRVYFERTGEGVGYRKVAPAILF